jgi:hypothetical protein
MNIPSEGRIANITQNDAVILPQDANKGRMEFSERTASHDSVSRLVADRLMCFATASDKAFKKIDRMSAIIRCQDKKRFYESTQCLIQQRPALWTASQRCEKTCNGTASTWIRRNSHKES